MGSSSSDRRRCSYSFVRRSPTYPATKYSERSLKSCETNTTKNRTRGTRTEPKCFQSQTSEYPHASDSRGGREGAVNGHGKCLCKRLRNRDKGGRALLPNSFLSSVQYLSSGLCSPSERFQVWTTRYYHAYCNIFRRKT